MAQTTRTRIRDMFLEPQLPGRKSWGRAFAPLPDLIL